MWAEGGRKHLCTHFVLKWRREWASLGVLRVTRRWFQMSKLIYWPSGGWALDLHFEAKYQAWYVLELSCQTLEKLKSCPWSLVPKWAQAQATLFTIQARATVFASSTGFAAGKNKIDSETVPARRLNFESDEWFFRKAYPGTWANIQICTQWSNHHNLTNRCVDGT